MATSNTGLTIVKGVKVNTLTTAEYKVAALALAEAFERDEVARYFIDVPDRAHWTEKQRWDLHLAMMEFITYAHCMAGLVTSAGDDHGAVALWMPPHAHMDSLWILIRSGMWRAMYKLSPEGRRRMFKEFFPLLHDTKVAALGDRDANSWYLVYLGTRPSARGKGYAKALIEHGAMHADRTGVPMYLESSNIVNVPYYRKFGFEVIQRVALLRNEKAVELDIMIREPGAKGQQSKEGKGQTLPLDVVDVRTNVKHAEEMELLGQGTNIGGTSNQLTQTDSAIGTPEKHLSSIVLTNEGLKRDSVLGT